MLNKIYAKKLECILIAFVCVFLILLARMAYLQIYLGEHYTILADSNRLRKSKVMAPRGIIYDNNGVELVNNLPGYAVTLLRRSQKVDDRVLFTLSEILEMPVRSEERRVGKEG